MDISFPTRRIFKPSSMAMLAVTASLAAWPFPTFGVLHKGFNHPTALDPTSVVVLACWYLLIFTSFLLGQSLSGLWVKAHPGPGRFQELAPLDSDAIYLGFTAIGCLGLGAMLWLILHNMTPVQALLFISLGQTNALKDSIYQEYHVGLVSLRYAVLYPGSIALYRMICRKQFTILNILNLLLILLAAFLSSRLLLIAAIVCTCFLVAFGRNSVKFRIWKVAATALFLFLVLGVLNFSRNADYYERSHLSFLTAGLNEIVAYLGTPFQVALGTAKMTGEIAAQGLGDPTHQAEPYRRYVDVAVNYNTNSAFVALQEQMGYWSWPYVSLLCCAMGSIFTFMKSLGKTGLLLPCGAILYAASEMWRLDLFQQGTFLVWFIVGVGIPLSYAFSCWAWRGLKLIYQAPYQQASTISTKDITNVIPPNYTPRICNRSPDK